MYSTVAEITKSQTLSDRCAAAAAVEQVNVGKDATTSHLWVEQHSWDFAATPGWAAAWESAVAGGNLGDIGLDPVVITDGMILARTQQLLAEFPMTPGVS